MLASVTRKQNHFRIAVLHNGCVREWIVVCLVANFRCMCVSSCPITRPQFIRRFQVACQLLSSCARFPALGAESRQVGIAGAARAVERHSVLGLHCGSIFRSPYRATGFSRRPEASEEAGDLALLLAQLAGDQVAVDGSLGAVSKVREASIAKML